MTLEILIIDDHPAMIEGYKSIITYNDLGVKINFTTANDCKTGWDIITDKAKVFDIVLLDIILPPCESLGLKSGEDLAVLIKKTLPHSKLMMLTSHTEAFVLYRIMKNISPAGLLVKSDFSAEELLSAFKRIVMGDTYQSATVRNGINDILKRNVYLDTYNRQIISLLTQGIKTKNLPQHLNLSISAIDKRKAQIKDFFEIEKGTDEDIIREAKKNGFV